MIRSSVCVSVCELLPHVYESRFYDPNACTHIFIGVRVYVQMHISLSVCVYCGSLYIYVFVTQT